jgi:3'-phosphoadenosine 5'-phosphosulfate sulfotransferase (PAPS reductase)/FAD synthetase
MTVNYCGQSTGKDSQAAALWLIHQSGVPRESIRFTFCDTKNEHQFVYDHLELLSERYQQWGCAPIVRLEPERGFLDLAKWKKRFPSRKARFCTQFLKVIPTRNDVTALIRADNEVIVHSGVRAGESVDRAKLIERGFDDMFGCVVNRPLLRFTLQEVLDLSKYHGVPLNPLYSYGFTRVGCFPCINSKKSEVKLISIHFPERIDQLEVEERAISTFFARKTVPERFRSLLVDTRKGPMKVATIRDVVRWSHTGKRAREIPKERLFDYDLIEEDSSLVCPSGMGMCE